MSNLPDCPLDQVEMLPVSNGDFYCPECFRHWYYIDDKKNMMASRPRKVRLVKTPEKGDQLSDIIKPLPNG